jgi:alcohol dehydrogenase, propanol-preferring
MATGPLVAVDRAVPEPGAGEIRVRVSVCGVCRTDLHLAEGDLAPRRPGVVPGHEIVGVVDAVGPGCRRFAVSDRAGIAWLRHTCGACRWCRRGQENLCVDPRFTGWDADGGYAEWAVVDERYAYALPDGFDDEHVAPLLCAGIIGYRALKRAELPPGGRLGIYGFGASAHLAAQIALAQGATVHVLTRSPAAQRHALDLGAHSAGPADAAPPEPLDAAILFAPAGGLVPVALAALDRGGTLSIAGIHVSQVPPLDYAEHLFLERQVRSVTANTRADGEELLALAARLGITVTTTPYPLDAADRALADLAADRLTGAAVLIA